MASTQTPSANVRRRRSAVERIVVITGSGISADSGIPTFRGSGGLWKKYKSERLATMEAFIARPALVWQWYRERRKVLLAATPNAAHFALVALADYVKEFLLITQNVDDLDARAGMPPAKVVHVHGELLATRCSHCKFRTHTKDFWRDGVPKCPRCRSNLRPGVVWFDEELPPREVERVEAFIARGPCDLVLVVGTSAIFDYVVCWALAATGTTGTLIEINPNATRLSKWARYLIREKAAKALPLFVEGLCKLSTNYEISSKTP